MNIEERLVKLEKSNRNYKIVIALCLCMFMVSAKDIFIKDEIVADKIYVHDLVFYDKVYQTTTTLTYDDIVRTNIKIDDFGRLNRHPDSITLEKINLFKK